LGTLTLSTPGQNLATEDVKKLIFSLTVAKLFPQRDEQMGIAHTPAKPVFDNLPMIPW
jgi:hypothetical protein